jgi:hypothetical protein
MNPATEAAEEPMSDDLTEKLEVMFSEMEQRTASLPKPIASVYASSDGNSLDVTLDTTKADYSEWIPGEGGDIGLHRDRDTKKVAGAHLPLYAKTLIVGGSNFEPLYIDLETGAVAGEAIDAATAELQRERDNYKFSYDKAINAVDSVFQVDHTKPPPLLPDFLRLGDCKFEGVVKLAKAYIELEQDNARLRAEVDVKSQILLDIVVRIHGEQCDMALDIARIILRTNQPTRQGVRGDGKENPTQANEGLAHAT